MDADDIIRTLDLRPHPEGGHYCETWRPSTGPDARPVGTAIYFLLRAGERSHWHRVDAAEIWHHYAGSALTLSIAEDAGHPVREHVLGTDLAAGERPQIIVPAGAWQAAEPRGPWVLVGCTVAPGFEFEHFELAPPAWAPETQTL
jgi:hypothetical protein